MLYSDASSHVERLSSAGTSSSSITLHSPGTSSLSPSTAAAASPPSGAMGTPSSSVAASTPLAAGSLEAGEKEGLGEGHDLATVEAEAAEEEEATEATEATEAAEAAEAQDRLALSWTSTPAPLVGRPHLASAYATADSLANRFRSAGPLDELVRASGELWQSFDQSVLGMLWPGRPWAPIPGGASHLKYRPKPPAPMRSSPPRPFKGAKWGVRGLRWKRLDEIDEIQMETADAERPVQRAATSRWSGGMASSSNGASGSSYSSASASARRNASRRARTSRDKAGGGGSAAFGGVGGGRSDGKFTVHPGLLDIFNDPGAACALKVCIRHEAFTLVDTLHGSSDDLSANFLRMRQAFLEGWDESANACYVLFRGDQTSWALFSFVSDEAPVREKMIYSWGRKTLVAGLGGNERIPWHDHWASLAEVVLPSDDDDGDSGPAGFVEEYDATTGATVLRERGHEHEFFDAMTEVERQLIQGERDALEEARRHANELRNSGAKPKASTGLSFL